MSLLDPFAPARAIADAVLYEGYVLYPYRASADKNRSRWQWGVVGPPGAHADGAGEEARMATDLAVEATSARVRLRLRFLQVVTRCVERLDPGGPVEVESVTVDGETTVSFDDTEERHVDLVVDLGDQPADVTVPFGFDATIEVRTLGVSGGVEHRLVRRTADVRGALVVHTEPVSDLGQVLHVEVRNTTDWDGGDRGAAVLRSLVGAHVLGAVQGGLFLSVLEPPAVHASLVERCRAHRLWPVLVGAAERASLVLASPVILYDQPEIAPESHGTFYDGLEIDELLSLRVLAMTDEEKREARATDPRSAAIVDRVDAMGPDELGALHGTIRAGDGRPVRHDDLAVPTIAGDGSPPPDDDAPWWDPGADARVDPATDRVVVDGVPISRGSVVRLRPARRADAHDIFYRDRVATVAAVVHDVDGSIHVAVTVDDDPAAALNDATGRYLYFAPDEVEPLGQGVER